MKYEEAILLIAEAIYEDYGIDPEEFVFPEGDDLGVRIEGLLYEVFDQVREALDLQYLEARDG